MEPPVIRLCSTALLATLGACATAASAPAGPPPSATSGTGIEGRILRIHNAERARVGAPPLAWDPALASQAQAYAFRIAPLRRLVHSSKAERGRTGENLWMGTRGAFPVETMVSMWAGEKRYFRPGLFPNNSSTGNWADVGHYTAMIWPTTTRVGCGLAAAAGNEVLVCRYAPGGNIDGRRLP